MAGAALPTFALNPTLTQWRSYRTEDILWNVLLTGVYGFALAAFQVRFRWLWPLVLVHALSDFAGILSPGSPGDAMIVVMHAGLVLFGVLLLRRARSTRATGRERRTDDQRR